MCALFGWLDYKGVVSDRLLKKLTQALANAAEERGTDASGIAYVKSGKITLYKRPKPAHKLRFNAPNGTRAIMGHTRMPTGGDHGERHCRCIVRFPSATGQDHYLRPGHGVCQLAPH